MKVNEIVQEIQTTYDIVGREHELKKVVIANLAGQHALIEGSVGVGKTILAKAVASHFNKDFLRVDGDERFTESKLAGIFDPPMVLKEGWTWNSFVPGPLTKAMQTGAILFINEANRLPEGTQNVLLPALDERQIIIPKLGIVKGENGFQIIATQNPEEFIGTTTLCEALKDRFVWVKLDYQSEEEERRIVKLQSQCEDDQTIKKVVAIVRTTRDYADLRRGSSVRGAIDLANIIRFYDSPATTYEDWVSSAIMALATKIELEDGLEKSIEEVIREIVGYVLGDF
ncbi:MAG: MoxR family ATPase [Candidatus Lokiarchaeota archaeon]|nr:MoxR family ATPase [Candidatus Lokiarchaeota archaeon]